MSMFFHTATVCFFIHIKEATQDKYKARVFRGPGREEVGGFGW